MHVNECSLTKATPTGIFLAAKSKLIEYADEIIHMVSKLAGEHYITICGCVQRRGLIIVGHIHRKLLGLPKSNSWTNQAEMRHMDIR